ncbi:wax ester/triacylglycerol synthase domain-containing protein [Streptomyces netropsis]
MTEYFPLSAVDECVARQSGRPPVVCMVLVLRGHPPALEELRNRVSARWRRVPRLLWVLVPPTAGSRGGRHHWKAEHAFCAEHHVAQDPAGPSLETWASGLLLRPLPPGRPPWQLHLMACPAEGEFALLLRAHHALADGQSLITLLRVLLDGVAAAVPKPRPHAPRATVRHVLGSFLGPGVGVPLPAGATLQPAHAWSPIDSETFRAARRALPDGPVTPTEVAMAATAGALRACFGAPDGVRGRGRLFVLVPVSLRTAGNADELGNITSSLRVPLPVHAATPAARLAACRGLVVGFGRRALEVPGLLARLLSPLGTRVMDAAIARAVGPPHTAVGCTALSWGSVRWALDGQSLARVVTFAGVPPAGACSFVLSSCAGGCAIAVTSHRLPGDARNLADAFTREVALLAGLGAV